MRNAIILTGIPGTGKTTIMKRLIGMMEDQHGSFSDEKIVQLIPSLYNEDTQTHILGVYDISSDDVFQGTDKLSLACQPQFEDFLNSIRGKNVVFEGDRLMNGKTIDSLMEHGYNVSVIHIEATNEELQRRYHERGSNQNPQFIQRCETKIERILTRFDLFGCIHTYQNMNEQDAEDIAKIMLTSLKQ